MKLPFICFFEKVHFFFERWSGFDHFLIFFSYLQKLSTWLVLKSTLLNGYLKIQIFPFFKNTHSRTFFFSLLLERQEARVGEREKERERDMEMRTLGRLPARTHPSGDRICSPGMCSDWESNLRPFGLQDDTPTHWATHCPGLLLFSSDVNSILWSVETR